MPTRPSSIRSRTPRPGSRGISFGNFLIKQVVDELARDVPNLKTFVTLSPMPGFARWLGRAQGCRKRAGGGDGWLRAIDLRTALEPELAAAAARYSLDARDAKGRPLDPVARFHLGNGASLDRINSVRRPLAARARTVLRRHGQLPLRSGVDREEPRSLCRDRQGRLLDGHPPGSRHRPSRRRVKIRTTTPSNRKASPDP